MAFWFAKPPSFGKKSFPKSCFETWGSSSKSLPVMKEFQENLDTQPESVFQTVRFWKAVNFPTAVAARKPLGFGRFWNCRSFQFGPKHSAFSNKRWTHTMRTNPSPYFTWWLLLVFGSILRDSLDTKKQQHEPRTKHQGWICKWISICFFWWHQSIKAPIFLSWPVSVQAHLFSLVHPHVTPSRKHAT